MAAISKDQTGGQALAALPATNGVGRSFQQEPVAVVGMACRLPGRSNSPKALWDFLERGGIAQLEAPETRFDITKHYDGSTKPRTMRSPGGMFLEDVDVRDIDAPFFGLSRAEAVAMDPQIRQTLEVVYEGLESAGLKLEELAGSKYACLVGSYAGDWENMQARDPEERVPSVTIGAGRAMLSNRVSHFLNLKGPSMTIDTGCSGSLVGLDVACRYLQTGEANGAIVAGANLYLNPDHNMDSSQMKEAHTLSGKCHTFDIKADGYVKGEAVNCVILKRLSDAVKDCDPIRAIVRGSATNSDGWTPGIASPSMEAQASATKQAYQNAGIVELNHTGYLECHGTGTAAGDPLETNGVSSVFAPTRDEKQPLIIGSIKSNVGHSEPAAGLSGLLKCIMILENGVIPGNPTFITPNPKIHFEELKIKATRTSLPYPAHLSPRRVSCNSFGYGGSNVHVVLDEPSSLLDSSQVAHVSSYRKRESHRSIFDDDDDLTFRPHLVVLSANDEHALKTQMESLQKHVIDPRTTIDIDDLCYTLSERRSYHFQRAFTVTQKLSLPQTSYTTGKPLADPVSIGLVFTGQGAQWSQMGKALIDNFTVARQTVQQLDRALSTLKTPPKWTILDELSQPREAAHMRKPEFSQPLVTAVQIILLEILRLWRVEFSSVVGHSSGEIAAAYAAGYLTAENAIKIAFLRGSAIKDTQTGGEKLGMLAVGLGASDVEPYLTEASDKVQIACFNSPNSVTLSGPENELVKLRDTLQAANHFARLLLVDMAYHSSAMTDAGKHYHSLLENQTGLPLDGVRNVTMYSSVSGTVMRTLPDATYWTSNMVQPVQFDKALTAMLDGESAPNVLLELGPSGALAGPIAQVKKSLQSKGAQAQYFATLARSSSPFTSFAPLYNAAGQLFIAGGPIDISAVNNDGQVGSKPRVIYDLPSYPWNHLTKYWHESDASKDWRYRKFPLHDLLGSKVLGVPWATPSFKKQLTTADLPWLKDHRMGNEVLFPAAGYIAMAMEALSQLKQATATTEPWTSAPPTRFHLRNVRFDRAMVLADDTHHKIMLSLQPHRGVKEVWYEFKVSSKTDDLVQDHCSGRISADDDHLPAASAEQLQSLRNPTPATLWYKALAEVGFSFGEHFRPLRSIESVSGARSSRATIDLTPPPSVYDQSPYVMHPTSIDGCFQAGTPALWAGHRSAINEVFVPAQLDELIICRQSSPATSGMILGQSHYIGVGLPTETRSYFSNVQAFDEATGQGLLELRGLRYHKLDTEATVQVEHHYIRSQWKPDFRHLSESSLFQQVLAHTTNEIHEVDVVLDLVSHSNPTLLVAEVFAGELDEAVSAWQKDPLASTSTRKSCQGYFFATDNASSLISVQENSPQDDKNEFELIDFTKPDVTVTPRDSDLVILHMQDGMVTQETCISNAQKLLKRGGDLLVIRHANSAAPLDATPPISNSQFQSKLLIPLTSTSNTSLADVTLLRTYNEAYTNGVHDKPLFALRFHKASAESAQVLNSLRKTGWRVEEGTSLKEASSASSILVLDELTRPVLTSVGEHEWQIMQELVAAEKPIVWVTQGGQMDCLNPSSALVHGLARSLRAEDPSLRFITVDVDSKEPNERTMNAIISGLNASLIPAKKDLQESEYVERGGVIHTNRILLDNRLNEVEKQLVGGVALTNRKFHASDTCIRLQAERLGSLEALTYTELSVSELPMLGPEFIEVEVYAAGLNFKDVAVSMGIVPENHHLLGLEGAGVVRRVGDEISHIKAGDRVLVHKKGSFANRVQCAKEGVYPIPDDMTFEQAATLTCVYLVSIYGLFHLAHLSRGQTVLIHSGAGGVGLAAIQLARSCGAEIFATVGTEEKRNYLNQTFGIAQDHMFSSRDTKFAAAIMEMTNGRGVDVILNSLTGAMLEESWRIIADRGNMIEIGKKDILDRNNLPMDPFNRNASFRAIDMSHKSIDDPLTGRLIHEMMELVKRGQIKPIEPMTVFSFEDIQGAFRYMRGGAHSGKIIISNGTKEDFEVPVRAAQFELTFRPDSAYLIVGGLKGLCGSLAIYMARCGARHIVVMSRSGIDDERSQGVVKNVEALGCTVYGVAGDVSDASDVGRAFTAASVPIRGIINGSMVLRDRIFSGMSVSDFHAAASCKVSGTWNLHNASSKLQLDFFTLLSSISGVIGQKAQANYAAANAFLDAFSAYRLAHGLPCNTVDLGVIEDVGYIAERATLAARLDNSLWNGGINEALLHRILRMSILQQKHGFNNSTGTQLITGIPVPTQLSSPLLASARFAGLVFGSAASTGARASSDKNDQVLQAFHLLLKSNGDYAAQLEACVGLANRQFSRILALAEPMEPAKPLSSYGLDSLAAVEFRNWCKTALGAEMTTLQVTNAKSLTALAEGILGKLRESAAA